MKPVAVAGVKNAAQLQPRPSGSGVAVWEIPTSRPRLFSSGQATLLLGPGAAPARALRSRAEEWRPGRSCAALHLWVAQQGR